VIGDHRLKKDLSDDHIACIFLWLYDVGLIIEQGGVGYESTVHINGQASWENSSQMDALQDYMHDIVSKGEWQVVLKALAAKFHSDPDAMWDQVKTYYQLLVVDKKNVHDPKSFRPLGYDCLWYAITNGRNRVKYRMKFLILVLSTDPEASKFLYRDKVKKITEGYISHGVGQLHFHLHDGRVIEVDMVSSDQQYDKNPDAILVRETRPFWEMRKSAESALESKI
jgi:hypothetical protein